MVERWPPSISAFGFCRDFTQLMKLCALLPNTLLKED
jgi:hypothetical protein